jgi:hypothetical protein
LFQKENHPMKKLIAAAFAALLFCVLPIVDQVTISIPADRLAYDVCWARFTFDFPKRWSCESTLKGNMVAILLGCAFNRGEDDICTKFRDMKAEMQQTKIESDRLKATEILRRKLTTEAATIRP